MGIIGSFQGYTDSPLYLLRGSVWSNLQTSGLTATYNGMHISYENKYQYMTYESASVMRCVYRLNQTIDLTSYNYVKITTEGCNEACIGVSTSEAITDVSSLTKCSSSYTTKQSATIICDVLSLTGSYYIYFCSTYTYMASLF